MCGRKCSGVYHGDHDTSISPCVLGVVYGGVGRWVGIYIFIDPVIPFN